MHITKWHSHISDIFKYAFYLTQMQDGDSVIQRVGYLDTNYTWYQVLVLSLYLYQRMLQQSMYRIISYQGLTSCLPLEIIKRTYYMVADPGYDDQNLYELSIVMGFQLLCPVSPYKTT